MMVDKTGYRRAAVVLHALSEADRQWVLGELPEADRLALSSCLKEMKALGFACVPGITEAIVPVAAALPEHPIEFIRDATAAEISAVLDGEPSSLVAQLLAVEEWRWKHSFMRMGTPVRQDRIRSAAVSLKELAPARRQFLVQAIGERVKAGRGASIRVAAPSPRRKSVPTAIKQAFSSFLLMLESWKR